MTEALALDWDDIRRDCRLLAAKLAGRLPLAGIVAVTRGGLVPAALLARDLDIRVIETVCVASYDDRLRGTVEILKGLPPQLGVGDGEGWLVVDDLADSGATARALRALLPKAHLAALYAKPDGLADLDTFVRTIAQNVWIVFPWEADT